MKKIWTATSLVALILLPLSASYGATAPAPAVPKVGKADKVGKGHAGKVATHRATLAQKRYRYLDMVARRHPSAIRDAVIVYEYGPSDGHQGQCDATDARAAYNAQSASACLRGPAT